MIGRLAFARRARALRDFRDYSVCGGAPAPLKPAAYTHTHIHRHFGSRPLPFWAKDRRPAVSRGNRMRPLSSPLPMGARVAAHVRRHALRGPCGCRAPTPTASSTWGAYAAAWSGLPFGPAHDADLCRNLICEVDAWRHRGIGTNMNTTTPKTVPAHIWDSTLATLSFHIGDGEEAAGLHEEIGVPIEEEEETKEDEQDDRVEDQVDSQARRSSTSTVRSWMFCIRG